MSDIFSPGFPTVALWSPRELFLSQQVLSLTWTPAPSLKPLTVLKLPVHKWEEISKCQSLADTAIKRSQLESEKGAWGKWRHSREGWCCLYIVTHWISTRHNVFILRSAEISHMVLFTKPSLSSAILLSHKWQRLGVTQVCQLGGSRVQRWLARDPQRFKAPGQIWLDAFSPIVCGRHNEMLKCISCATVFLRGRSEDFQSYNCFEQCPLTCISLWKV